MAAVDGRTMTAVVRDEYGPPDRLRVQQVARPLIEDDEVLVRVRAASVNPFDWHALRGVPYLVRIVEGLRRPKRRVLGVDVAGTVEAVGANVTEFRPGDEVLGSSRGTFAEYTVGREQNFFARPEGLSFEETAAVPGAGVTALQAVRDHGAVSAGQRVLINGAAGGVGTFSVQIAKAFGAHTTGVCSTTNLELVSSLGADCVIDYTDQDFTQNGQRYDVIVDNVGNHPLLTLRRALGPHGTLVVVAGGEGGRVLGGLARKLRTLLLNRFVSQNLVTFIANIKQEDLAALTTLIEAGTITPVLDRTYPLAQVADAIRYVEDGHARGKVVITV